MVYGITHTQARPAQSISALLGIICIFTLLCGCTSTAPKPNDIGRTYVPRKTADSAPSRKGNSTDHPKIINAPKGIPDIAPTVVGYDQNDYNDPIMGFNRAVFAFNDIAYRYALIPIARGYNHLPQPLRTSVSDFFYNIKTPIYLLNNSLQLKGKSAWHNIARFVINSTLGLAGLFDPAQKWFGLERAEAHLNDTLIHYGADYGFYIVLPLLGPSDIRDSTSALSDYFLNPIRYLTKSPDHTLIQGVDTLQDFSSEADSYTTLRDKSDDPYLLFRNLYLQGVMRDADYE